MGKAFESDRYPNTGYSMKDTSPEVNEMMYQRLMALSGEERVLMGFSMIQSAKEMILASLPEDITEPERKKMLYERYYGEAMPEELYARIQKSFSSEVQ